MTKILSDKYSLLLILHLARLILVVTWSRVHVHIAIIVFTAFTHLEISTWSDSSYLQTKMSNTFQLL